MKYTISSLYNRTIPDLEKQIHRAINKGLTQRAGAPPVIFFRADDIGVPSRQFSKMVELFSFYNLPLCLAVVPTWLTRPRWLQLLGTTGNSELFCWHQHGWLHKNYELTGKKQEFGPSRTEYAIQRDLAQGRQRLQNLLGQHFSPFFTPPWNRCGKVTLNLLEKLRFKGISRSRGASPPAPVHFPDFQVNVDLHTRKETDIEISFAALLTEIEAALFTGCTGIMLHHQRMNKNAFELLDVFLRIISETPELRCVLFDNMIEHPENDDLG